MQPKLCIVKSPRTLTVLIGGLLLACSVGFALLWNSLAREKVHYPNAETLNCGFNPYKFQIIQRWWVMVTFVQCFSTRDQREQVHDWYVTQGWDSPGDRLIYPGWQLGRIYFEKGKEFQAEVKQNGTTLIYQVTIYRVGPCIAYCK